MKISEAIGGTDVILTPGKLVQVTLPEMEARLAQLETFRNKLDRHLNAIGGLRGLEDDEDYPEVKALYDKVDMQIGKLRTQIDQLERDQQNDQSHVDIFDTLERECSIALQGMREANRLLFRGMNTDFLDLNNKDHFLGRAREDRQPTGSDKRKSSLVDHLFVRAGMKALRSNSIYCSASSGQASSYGTVYIIFPRNGFEFTATKHRDLISIIDHKLFNVKYDEDANLQRYNNPETRAVFEEWWQRIASRYVWCDYKVQQYLKMPLPVPEHELKTDFSNGRRGLETVIDFVAHNYDGPQKEIPPDLRLSKYMMTPEEMIEYVGPQNDDFVAALKSEKEIMIAGEYYAFKRQRWGEKIRDWMTKKTGAEIKLRREWE